MLGASGFMHRMTRYTRALRIGRQIEGWGLKSGDTRDKIDRRSRSSQESETETTTSAAEITKPTVCTRMQ